MTRIIQVVLRRFTAVVGMVVLALAGFALTSPAASATPAAVNTSTTSERMAPMSGNSCGLPTHAHWPSYYDGSYSNCWVCLSVAGILNGNYWFPKYYCTYNPSNGLTDLHHD